LFVTIVAAWIARPSPPQNATDRWLGEMSYPLFVSHGPAIIGLQFALNAWSVHLPFAANLAILLAASFATAMCLLTVVERPVMAWRRRIRLPWTTTARASLVEPAAS
jgi:peptidoglycan/LPS O-acetylase OafA/YrhL